MLLSPIKRLCIILPTLIAATPQNTHNTESTPSSLPLTLQRDVPACAQPCLQQSLSERFPLACTVQINLNCLCSRYSFYGESLGEVALLCIYQACSTVDRSAASAYNVCLGQRDAVLPTQTALTVVASSSLPSTYMASSTPVVTIKTTKLITSASHSTPLPTDTVAVDSVSLIPSATSSTSPSPSTQPIAVEDPPRTMKPAQIAGLSVAAAATFVIAIGLMALSVFLRKRREKAQVTEISDKKGKGSPPREYSTRFSQYPPPSYLPSEPPSQFPLLPAPVLRKTSGRRPQPKTTPTSNPKHVNPKINVFKVPSRSSPPTIQPSDLSLIHPLLRPEAATASNNVSESSLPLDQIGLAISAELPGKTAAIPQFPRPPPRTDFEQHRQKRLSRTLEIPQRPESVLTQDTVFEEDDVPQRRRSSRLLPTPPIPIPPIRSLQASRAPATTLNTTSRAGQTSTTSRQIPQQPELFLNIPARHERPQPKRIVPMETSRDIPASPPQRIEGIQFAPASQPPFLHSSSKLASTNERTPEPSIIEDIPDYYFTAHQDSTQKYPTPKASPGRLIRSRESPKVVQIKPKMSSSTVSRTPSRASTNVRDSMSSQTSFETADPNDPTPDDEDDDKQLSDDNRLSPVAESPISHLRYPKVPRASNQLVPRSPKSPQSQKSQGSPCGWSEPSALLVKRRGEREPLRIESGSQMGSPNKAEVRSHMRNFRQHLRSNSVETWNTNQISERSTRVLSGQWPKSPAMYDSDLVQPLNIRSRQPPPEPVDMNTLKSPVWVPRLTPTRQGEDLFISVTYSKPGR